MISRFLQLAIGSAAVLSCTAGTVSANVLFYGGDSTFTSYALNQQGFTSPDVEQYDDFAVPNKATWTITSLFANVFFIPSGQGPPASTEATYEIRIGVSSGIAGTLVASGTVADSLTPVNNGTDDYYELDVTTSPIDAYIGDLLAITGSYCIGQRW